MSSNRPTIILVKKNTKKEKESRELRARIKSTTETKRFLVTTQIKQNH